MLDSLIVITASAKVIFAAANQLRAPLSTRTMIPSTTHLTFGGRCYIFGHPRWMFTSLGLYFLGGLSQPSSRIPLLLQRLRHQTAEGRHRRLQIAEEARIDQPQVHHRLEILERHDRQ